MRDLSLSHCSLVKRRRAFSTFVEKLLFAATESEGREKGGEGKERGEGQKKKEGEEKQKKKRRRLAANRSDAHAARPAFRTTLREPMNPHGHDPRASGRNTEHGCEKRCRENRIPNRYRGDLVAEKETGGGRNDRKEEKERRGGERGEREREEERERKRKREREEKRERERERKGEREKKRKK